MRTAHEIGVGVYGNPAISVMKKFPRLALTTSSIAPKEVASAPQIGRANGVDLVCIQSDLLESVSGTFDLIWWNLPYYDAQILQFLDRLFCQLRDRGSLRPGGRLVLGFNTVPLEVASVRAIVARNAHLRVEKVERFWWNPHCILTLQYTGTDHNECQVRAV